MKQAFLLLAIIAGFAIAPARAQNPDSSKYIDVCYIKSKSPVYVNLEKTVWKPLQQQLIKQGNKSGWYLYHVKYPGGSSAAYDYVVVNVYPEWNSLDAPSTIEADALKKINPRLAPDSLNRQTDRSREIVWKQLFQLMGQSVAKEKSPSRFIVVNEVKTVAGGESEYVKLEQTWFKPFHAARASLGIMNNWGLYKRTLPYGEKFSFDYVTLNGYLNWEDITRNNPPDAWKKVHGDVNFNEVHEKILSKRITVNNEVWELVDYVSK